MILGTAAYMSPEQARGKTVDKRADIWAFGVVLYEMLTGRRAFEGDDVSETLASVLKDTLDFASLPETPPALGRLIERCVERDAKPRLRDIGEARIEMSGSEAARRRTSGQPPRSSDRVAAWTSRLLAGRDRAGRVVAARLSGRCPAAHRSDASLSQCPRSPRRTGTTSMLPSRPTARDRLQLPRRQHGQPVCASARQPERASCLRRPRSHRLVFLAER